MGGRKEGGGCNYSIRKREVLVCLGRDRDKVSVVEGGLVFLFSC